jgi:uncharacterized protein
MKIRVEVVYALADTQTIIGVELEQGARVMDALAASGLERLAGQSSCVKNIGIWGRPALPDTELRDQDRVEIYRGLVADPKQARRHRAKLQRGTKTRR